MKKKVLFVLALFASFFAFCGNVDASEVINVSNETEYLDAIATINSSSETAFVINLTSDVVLDTALTAKAQVTLTGTKNVTILGDNHALKISNTGSYGYNPVLIVDNGVTVTLGKEDGSDKLSIQGGGKDVSTSESLFNVRGVVNFYDGVSIGDNHSGYGALNGGAFRVGVNGTVNMYGGRIHDNSNTSNCYGGAVMLDEANGTFNMYDGIFENNSTCHNYGAYGGAIFINDYSTQTATVNIEGGTFKNNSSYYGGAIANVFGNLNIKNATFEGNEASGEPLGDDEPSGGAIVQYSYKELNIDNSKFVSNNAYSGGAVFAYAMRVNVSKSEFKNNTATLNGGAVIIGDYGTFVSEENVYENNTAEKGGAIYNGRRLYTFDDIIKDNVAKVGGGVYAAGLVNTINSDVYSNKATEAANDIFITDTAGNLDIKDPSTIDATVTFEDGITNIKGWFNDASGNRFTVSNPTDAVDTITAGNEYALTAAGEETTIEYEVIKGAGQTYTIDENENAVFEINADYSVFENGGKVYVDGKEVSNDNYTSKSGSTIITFKKAYMDGLSVGEHTLKVTFTDGGSATTTFTVAEVSAIENPQTGDGIVKYMIVLVVTMAGLVGFGIYRKKANK